MIVFNNLTLARRLVCNFSGTIPAATLTALTGCNGAGKSTLLRTLTGTERPLSGSIAIGNLNPTTAPPRQLAEVVAIVTARRMAVSHLSVRQLVAMGRAPYTGLFGRLNAADCEAVERAMSIVGIDRLAERMVSTLSDGEYQRVSLARAVAQDTPVILLDEPTGFLDVPNRRLTIELLAALAHKQGKCIVYSTHEIPAALAAADLILHLADGQATLLPPAQTTQLAAFAPML